MPARSRCSPSLGEMWTAAVRLLLSSVGEIEFDFTPERLAREGGQFELDRLTGCKLAELTLGHVDHHFERWRNQPHERCLRAHQGASCDHALGNDSIHRRE